MAYSKEQKEEIFDSIFNDLEKGSSLRKALKKVKIPAITFYEWIDAEESKAKHYVRVKELGIEARFESIEEDYSERPRLDPETGRIDTGWVQLQRLKIDSKKWELSKLNPKKYGNTIDVTSGGEKVNNAIPIVMEDGRTYEDLKNELNPE